MKYTYYLTQKEYNHAVRKIALAWYSKQPSILRNVINCLNPHNLVVSKVENIT